jgi:hypothetical protein
VVRDLPHQHQLHRDPGVAACGTNGQMDLTSASCKANLGSRNHGQNVVPIWNKENLRGPRSQSYDL